MEKINKPQINQITSLQILAVNWEEWGSEYSLYLSSNKSNGVGWSWRNGIYLELRAQLELLTFGHCSFCDGYPIGENSKETIEHYYPKNDFPNKAYDWNNLFYCCDKCQSEANKKSFEYTLKPDDDDYSFDKFFYFDLETGRLEVLENIEIENPLEYERANQFLIRYGINSPKRNSARKHLLSDVKNYYKSQDDDRTRTDFKYRYIFDSVANVI